APSRPINSTLFKLMVPPHHNKSETSGPHEGPLDRHRSSLDARFPAHSQEDGQSGGILYDDVGRRIPPLLRRLHCRSRDVVLPRAACSREASRTMPEARMKQRIDSPRDKPSADSLSIGTRLSRVVDPWTARRAIACALALSLMWLTACRPTDKSSDDAA